MSAILSHPFRLAPNGVVAAVEQTSDQANAEQIAVLATTRVGERPLSAGFGIPDPVFAPGGLHGPLLAAAIGLWGPPVQVDGIDVTWVDDATQVVQVRFT